jgi:hypothetical protein
MIDLETRLRETMDRHSPSPTSHPMPANTASRVLRRRAAAVATTMVFAIAFVVGAAGLFGYLSTGPADQPAGEATVAMPTPLVPTPTEGGVTYVTPAPFADLRPGAWPNVEVGGVEDPYVDREVGDELDKTVVASGLVEGTEWSMTAFALRGSGTCGELFLADMGDDGGVRFCSRVESEPGQTDLRVAGTSFGLGPVTAYTGVVSPAVDRVVLELADGSRRSVDLVNAPNGLDDRSFVVFVPIDAGGRVLALDAGGGPVAAEPLCVGSPAPLEQVTSCGNGLATTFSAVSAQP